MAITITVDTNYDQIRAEVNETLQQLIDNQEPFLLAIASSVLATVAYRVHTKGKRANGTDLGTYSSKYMKERERNNRTDERKVVASLTRQMENDFSVVAEGSSVGLGFKNVENFKKAGYVEQMYPGTYLLTSEEEDIIIEAANSYIDGIFT